MKTILSISALLASVAFLLMGHGLLLTLLPLRGVAEGFSSGQLGGLGAFYFLGFAFGTVIGPHAIGRVGHIRTFAAMVALVCLAVLAQSLLTVPVFWWLTRAMTGLALAALYIVIESWLNAAATNENRGMVFSIYTVINLGVITVGQLLTSTADIEGFTLFAVATMLLVASTIPVSLSQSQAPAPARAVKLRLGYLFRLSPVAVFGAVAIGAANGAFWTLGPVFAQSETGDVTLVAIFMSVTVLAGAIGQLPLGWLSDHTDRRKVILLASMGAAVAAVGHVLAARYWQVGILPCAAVFGLFALPLYALCAAHLNDNVEDDGFIEASSGLLLLYAGGAIAGPLIASAAMSRFGADVLFVFISAMHLTLVVFAAIRICWRKPVATDDKVAFANSLVSASTVANIEHRSDVAE